jgi:hypothetical protein
MFSHTSKIAIAAFTATFLFLLKSKKQQSDNSEVLSIAEQFPEELLFKTFEYLKPDELVKASAVSTQWRRVADDKCLWAPFSFASREGYLQTKRPHKPEVLTPQQIFSARSLLNKMTGNIKIHLLGTDDSHREIIFNLNRPDSDAFYSRTFFGLSPRFVRQNGYQFNIMSQSDSDDVARIEASKNLSKADIALICISSVKDFSLYKEMIENSSNSSIFFLYVLLEVNESKLLANKDPQTIIFSQGDTLESFVTKVVEQIEHIAKSEPNSFFADLMGQIRTLSFI